MIKTQRDIKFLSIKREVQNTMIKKKSFLLIRKPTIFAGMAFKLTFIKTIKTRTIYNIGIELPMLLMLFHG